jgi:polyisoprenoid-binding protein YceI
MPMAVSVSPSRRATSIAAALVITGLAGAMVSTAAADPAVAHYALDPAKSALEYQFVQAGAQNKGKFLKFSVTLDFSPDSLAGSKLDVVVDTNSLDTGDKDRDTTLRSPDLFDVAKYPQAHFTSTQITKIPSGYDAAGKLTIRGVTRDQHIVFTFRSAAEQGKSVGYLSGKAVVKRLDFGVGQGDWKSTDWVANEVTVTYSLRLLPQ